MARVLPHIHREQTAATENCDGGVVRSRVQKPPRKRKETIEPLLSDAEHALVHVINDGDILGRVRDRGPGHLILDNRLANARRRQFCDRLTDLRTANVAHLLHKAFFMLVSVQVKKAVTRTTHDRTTPRELCLDCLVEPVRPAHMVERMIPDTVDAYVRIGVHFTDHRLTFCEGQRIVISPQASMFAEHDKRVVEQFTRRIDQMQVARMHAQVGHLKPCDDNAHGIAFLCHETSP